MKQIFVIILIVTNLVAGDIDILWDYEKFYKYLKDNLSSTNISSSCSLELKELFRNNDTLYDLYDATSKYPWSGLKTGTKSDLGNFDQCVNIDHPYSEGKILGQYCLQGLNLLGGDNEVYSLALCMPSGCTANDYSILFNSSVSSFSDTNCITKEYVTNYTAGDIAMIVVFLAFAVCIGISTIYDVYLYKSEKKTAHPVYLAFSAFTNLRKLLHTSKGNKEHILIFNGLRTFFTMWTIVHHLHSVSEILVVSNIDSLKKRPVLIHTAHLSNDGFFFMSGFLQAYGYLKQKNTSVISQIANIPSLIIHRYMRLTPALAMTYFTHITLFKHISFGPSIKILFEETLETCRQNWLPFFLYYQNYNTQDNICLLHTWFMSAFMQLFVLSPLILIPVATLLGKNKTNFKPVMHLLLVWNIFALIMPIAAKLLTNKSDIYDYATHFRISVYSIGIMMGTFMRQKKDMPFLNNVKSKLKVNFLIWIGIFILMVITVVVFHHYTYNGYSENVMLISHNFLRSLWCVGLCWMVYSSYHGHGGIINWILTRPTLQITARASYCMYVVQVLVLFHYIVTIRTRLWFDGYLAFITFCGHYVLIFGLAIIWSISFESPMVTIEQLIFGKGKSGRQSGGKEQKGNAEKAETREQPIPRKD